MRHFSNLQAMRGIAALMIVLIHALGTPGLGLAWSSPFWSIGPAGVDLFFVISGFVITTVAVGAGTRSTANVATAKNFAIKRLVRIYPLFWIALAVFWVAYPRIAVHGTELPHHSVWWLATLMEQFNYLIPAAWTLQFELYFYLVMTVILAIAPEGIYRGVAVWGALSLAIITVAGVYDRWMLFEVATSPMLLEFMAGAFIAYVIGRNETRFAAAYALLGLILFLVGGWINSQLGDWHPVYRVICFGAPSALIIYGVLAVELRHGILFPKPLQRLGDVSYSLYVWHQPLVFAVASGFAATGLSTILPIWAALILTITLLVGWSYISYHWLERPIQTALLRWILPVALPTKLLWPVVIAGCWLVIYAPAHRLLTPMLASTTQAAAAATSDTLPQTAILKGDPQIKEATAIGIPRHGQPIILTVGLHGEGKGILYFGYHSEGKLIEQWRDFADGDNSLEITVPVALDGNDVWIAREKPYTDMKVTSVSVR
jgi:peptidoglycan/LPS O-acetylase OafA/YrhL